MDRLTEEYRLVRRIGRGGMGEVWDALRVKAGRIVVPCAIKLLHADFTETARERELFFAEAKIATQLDHGRIVKVIDLDTDPGGRPFLVMERVDGVNLRSFLKAARDQSIARLDLDLATYIVGEILFALDYAHGRNVGGSDGGVIHSDVTPGNILLSSSGEVKLTDFGIARFAATAGPMSRAVGTPRYMSPEQLSGAPQRETDIYGLGVVLHELLEGERFLDGLTPDQFRSRVLMGPPPDLKRDDVPAWLDDLRRRMVATDPRQRPSAGEARDVLAEHCPRYLGAAVRLGREYARLVGRARSGVTQQLAAEASAGPIVAPLAPTPEAPGREADGKTPDASEPEVAPTEILPPPPAEESRPHPGNTGWLAVGFALAALAMCFVGLSFLVRVLREPGPASASAAADPPHASRPAPAPELRPEPEPEPVQDPPFGSTSSPGEPQPPTDKSPSPSAIAAPDPAAPSAIEPEVQPEAAGEPPPKAKTKTSAKVEIGVMFLVETNVEGNLKWGSKIIPVKNRSAYAELPTGSYRLSWRPEGGESWEAHGRLTIKDIAPMHYQVRIRNGKITQITEIPA